MGQIYLVLSLQIIWALYICYTSSQTIIFFIYFTTSRIFQTYEWSDLGIMIIAKKYNILPCNDDFH